MASANASHVNIEMQAVDSRMNNSALGAGEDGMNIEDIAGLTSPTGGSLGNRVAPDGEYDRRKDINQTAGLNQKHSNF